MNDIGKQFHHKTLEALSTSENGHQIDLKLKILVIKHQ